MGNTATSPVIADKTRWVAPSVFSRAGAAPAPARLPSTSFFTLVLQPRLRCSKRCIVMPKVSQAIISFLSARKAAHNGPDLLERYLQYAGFMETQVNVSAGKGWPVDGKKSTYTDGL